MDDDRTQVHCNILRSYWTYLIDSNISNPSKVEIFSIFYSLRGYFQFIHEIGNVRRSDGIIKEKDLF